jgi:hypothetical protein
MRASRWEPAPTAYRASAPARPIGRLCDGKAPKTPTKPRPQRRVLAREPKIEDVDFAIRLMPGSASLAYQHSRQHR